MYMKNKGIKQKLEQAQRLLDILVKKKDLNLRLPDRFYYVLKIFQQTRKEYESTIIPNHVVSESETKRHFDRPRREITSLAYKRWQKRIGREIDNRFKNRR